MTATTRRLPFLTSHRVAIFAGSLLVCAFMFLPFVWGFILSFKDNTALYSDPLGLPRDWDFSLYVDTFQKSSMPTLFRNSFIVASLTTVGCLLINFPSSFAIARLHHRNARMGDFFYYLFLIGSAVPLFITLYPIYTIAQALQPFGLGIDSIFGLIPPYVAGSLPFNTLVFVGAMRSIPLELEEAAILDGCSLRQILVKITLPLMAPIVATLAIFNFLGAWNEWTLASILLNSSGNYTIPLAASFFKQQYGMDAGAVMRAVIIVLIPQLIFYAIFQKRIVQGMATTGLKG
jgi:raffinose/stachyose/melibiose transport system permease protein